MPIPCPSQTRCLVIYINIPVHNEAPTIGVLLWKIRKVFLESGRDFRIQVLDDASTDRTGEVLERYAKRLPLRVIRSDQRLGYGQATERLLRESVRCTRYPKRDVALVLQGDFTEDPEVLVEMVKRVEGGSDLVAGCIAREDLPRDQRRSRWLAGLLLGRVLKQAPVSEPLSGPRAFRIIVLRKAFRGRGQGAAPLVRSDGWAANLELLAGTTPHARRVEEVPMKLREMERSRESRFRPWWTVRKLLPLRRVAWPAAQP